MPDSPTFNLSIYAVLSLGVSFFYPESQNFPMILNSDQFHQSHFNCTFFYDFADASKADHNIPWWKDTRLSIPVSYLGINTTEEFQLVFIQAYRQD